MLHAHEQTVSREALTGRDRAVGFEVSGGASCQQAAEPGIPS
jgi:hypothetical protein